MHRTKNEVIGHEFTANDTTGSIETRTELPQILFITSYPPRECGIATYSHDLVSALQRKFADSFTILVCPLETATEHHRYNDALHILNTESARDFYQLAEDINRNDAIKIILLQHEFGFFAQSETDFLKFMESLNKQVIVTFHTVLPQPDKAMQSHVQRIAAIAGSIIVMTKSSEQILVSDYDINPDKIVVIPHGTHLVPLAEKETLKTKYGLSGKKVLSTFGLLSSGKNIETTLQALPEIVKEHPDVLFLIIGKTHPSVIKQEGELYRKTLHAIVEKLELEPYVKFINQFLPLPELLEYLQLTDIYLFTSNNPNQAVSGTFSYAISSGCPVISTPIPHAREVLQNDAGITIPFGNSKQLCKAVNGLLHDDLLRANMSSNGLHKMAATAWENSAIAHALLFEELGAEDVVLKFTLPPINLEHIKKMTTHFGIIQFAKISHPDILSGYTLDDNARALVAMCQLYQLDHSIECLQYIRRYFAFIKTCLQPDGSFFNYMDEMETFTPQNETTNLADSNGRAVWALGFLISLRDYLPVELVAEAQSTMQSLLRSKIEVFSPRAMSFIIKGLYYRHTKDKFEGDLITIKKFANRLVAMYRHESTAEWLWFESYLTYANSVLSEAMLCAWAMTGDVIYKDIAEKSFDFLLSKTFSGSYINVISNKTWLQKSSSEPTIPGGEQPIDVAYTILALKRFYDVFKKAIYKQKLEDGFSWFLGNNHLHQIMYNPSTGGCYDGLEEFNVNLNQGAESTVSYLMARLVVEEMNRDVIAIEAGTPEHSMALTAW
jgi:glycosyltransferase involved in cell wall biosynthesis